MTDDWDFYPLQVDSRPASIFVDLGIEAAAPLASLAHMAWLQLEMNHPRPDGLSSQEEFKALCAVEDAIEARLCSDEIGYVGRCTGGGTRDFYFYVSRPGEWERQVGELLAAFPSYRFEAGTREDAQWSTYFRFLRPGDTDRQRIENRRVCQALERHGDKLEVEREIDHFGFFPSRAAAQAFAAEAETLGFALRGLVPTDDEPPRFSVHLTRRDMPAVHAIDGITQPLFDAARRHGGDYDGWGCGVEA